MGKVTLIGTKFKFLKLSVVLYFSSQNGMYYNSLGLSVLSFVSGASQYESMS